jgi:hypothetical protein
VALVADDDRELLGAKEPLALHQGLDRCDHHLRLAGRRPRALFHADAQPGQVGFQGGRGLVEELTPVSQEENAAGADERQESFDDETRDHRLAGAGRQVEQHAARAAPVESEHLLDRCFLIWPRHEAAREEAVRHIEGWSLAADR